MLHTGAATGSKRLWVHLAVLGAAAALLGALLVGRAWANPAPAGAGPGSAAAMARSSPNPDSLAPAPPARTAAPESAQSFGKLFNTSPIINGIILALSVVSLGLFVFFWMTINTKSMVPPDFIDSVTRLVIDRKYDEAAQYCRGRPQVFASTIVQRCVENAGKEHSVIMDMLDSEGRRRADIVWNRLSYLADVANVAPMLGLLGTVVGMIQAFYGTKFEAHNLASPHLTDAIGGAMSTTMFGLVVAITTLIFYSVIKARATRALADAEQVVHSIADYIKRGAS